MSSAVSSASPSREVIIARLREQVNALEHRVPSPVRPVPPVLAPLLPDGGLKPGAVYCLASPAVLLALLAAPSHEGLWCGLVGLPEVGAEAAAAAGVRLDRLALVPRPGPRWLSVVAALCTALPVVAVCPPAPVRPGEADRLAARLRDEGTTLLVVGTWPMAEASITVTSPIWWGLGDGWGHLTGREVDLQVTSKRHPWGRSVRAWLPGADGTLAVAGSDVPEGARAREETAARMVA